MQFHPHLHVLVPAAALGGENGCAVIRAQYPHYLLPYAALAHSYRQCFLRELHAKHPGLDAELDPQVRRLDWNVNLKFVGRGKKAIRYLAAYVNKSAFSERHLLGYDAQERLQLRYTDSADGQWKLTALSPIEFHPPLAPTRPAQRADPGAPLRLPQHRRAQSLPPSALPVVINPIQNRASSRLPSPRTTQDERPRRSAGNAHARPSTHPGPVEALTVPQAA